MRLADSSEETAGVELGIFSPTPTARRLGKNAAMADGLFDFLPTFPNASTSEILDIRTELSSSLGAFRGGIGSLTESLDVAPDDPDFGPAVESTWNETVAPAIDEIEALVRQNRSMMDLLSTESLSARDLRFCRSVPMIAGTRRSRPARSTRCLHCGRVRSSAPLSRRAPMPAPRPPRITRTDRSRCSAWPTSSRATGTPSSTTA